MAIQPKVLGGRTYEPLSRMKSRCIVHWRSADLGVECVTGQTLVYTRAGPGGHLVDSRGRLYLPVQGEPAFDCMDYDGDGYFETPGLRVDNVSTNQALRSEEFNDAAWTKRATAITVDTKSSPRGDLTADVMTEDGTTGLHDVGQNITITAGDDVVLSVFARDIGAGANRLLRIEITDGAAGSFATFNLLTGVLFASAAVSTGTLRYTKIEKLGFGWFRLIMAGKVAAASTTVTCLIEMASASGSQSYAGDATSAVAVWGAQAESGTASPRYSSYVQTVGSTVTKTAGTARIPVNLSADDYTMYLRLKHEKWMDIAVSGFNVPFAGVTVGIPQLSVLKQGNTTLQARFNDGGGAPLGVAASVISVASDPIEVCAQWEDLATIRFGVCRCDIGFGFGTDSVRGTIKLAAFLGTNFAFGEGDGAVPNAWLTMFDAKLARGLFTLKEMREMR